ncbi:DNA primase/helicase [Arthrobacter phage VroomVroom]|uniref:DNA primase/helicase n=1 Tax=Arthrobacter phage VroomVroom TaxID=3049371 RepID=A0AA49FAH1_9CAUD|nr:DNA primase/helicase [Arthrobacter phage VroomVroom]
MTLDELLKSQTDVVEEADGYLIHCPAHPDSKQSLRITVSDAGKVLLKCRAGCKTGDVVKALGITMKDLASMTAGDVKLEHKATSTDTPASPAAVAALAVKLDAYAAAIDPEARAYAADRFGFTDADVERLGLGLATDLGGGPRLVVPFRDRDGVARGFQARALEKDAAVRWLGPKSPEGESWARVGYFPGVTGYEEVLITEGPSDALTSVALGFDTIGIRGAGLASNPSVIEDVVRLLDGREAVVAGDGDPSGRRFSSLLADALVARDLRVRVLDVPDGLDLNDWRSTEGVRFQGTVLKAIAEAEVVKSRSAALLAWDEERYSLSDLGGARYLRDYVESIGSGVRFSEEVGFFLLENGVWRRDERQAVRTHAQAVADIVRNLARDASMAVAGQEDEAVSAKDKKRAGRLNAYAKHVQTSRGIDAMLRELQAVQGVPASFDDFDKHPDLVAARNGIVDLRTGELRPHDPSLLLTKRIDLDYDPEAKAPRWEAFLDQVFPAYPDLPAYMQRLVGYGITGHTAEQCFAVLWGTGANGKSVFTDTLSEVFGELTTTTPFSTFEDRGSGGIPNDIAALKGARQVFAAEGEQGKPMSESVLKRVTGRDLVTARFMRKEFFSFRPTFLLYLATNFKPSFKGQDDGLWRRVKLIPWERFFAPEERDHKLGDKLLAEAEGIFAWAVKGARDWYKDGLKDPAIIVTSTKEYRETSDALAGFLPGMYIHDAEAGRVDGSVLFESYLQWADEENLPQRERWTRRTFFAALEERGLVKRRVTKGVAFDGVRRARQTDHAPEEAVSPGRVVPTGKTDDLALSTTDTNSTESTPTLQGADLDSYL